MATLLHATLKRLCQENGYRLVTLACHEWTGHGIPGGYLSVQLDMVPEDAIKRSSNPVISRYTWNGDTESVAHDEL